LTIWYFLTFLGHPVYYVYLNCVFEFIALCWRKCIFDVRKVLTYVWKKITKILSTTEILSYKDCSAYAVTHLVSFNDWYEGTG